MPGPKKKEIAQLPAGTESPLSFAANRRDQKTLEMVRTAIQHKQVLLAYQPIVQAAAPGKTAFYEGLIRVLDDTGRVIPAGSFMGAIEDNELGRELDTLALHLGLKALHENPQLRLSINMSARSVGYRPWNRTLERWLDRNELLAERLVLEITESSAMLVPELVIDFMDRLQMRGICFAMDDFGSGYTALRYFKDFFFDMIKIDGQFITGIANNNDNQVVVAAIISIARHFDMLTVAEFVENEEDAQTLTRLGVDCLQGYHYAVATTRPDWMKTPEAQPAV